MKDRVQGGALGAHAARKYLVPMAPAKRSDCLRLIKSLGEGRPSTREVGVLHAAWVSGNAKTRELVLTQPFVVLRAREQAVLGEPIFEKTLGRKPVDDFGILIGTSRRDRRKLTEGVLSTLLPPEDLEAQRAAQQAQWRCESLLRSATALPAQPTSAAGAEGAEAATLEATDVG